MKKSDKFTILMCRIRVWYLYPKKSNLSHTK